MTSKASDRPPHESSSPYKHQRPPGSRSPPLTGTRGYPYPQDPTRSSQFSAPSAHIPVSVYATPSQLYRENPYQTERASSEYVMERYRVESDQMHQVRRRPSLLPTPDYAAAERLDRERYLEALRYNAVYDREVVLPTGASFTNTGIMVSGALGNSGLQPPSLEMQDMVAKRPRLAMDHKAPIHQQLLIDTREIVEVKKEPAYTPQVEAISPTLPSDDIRGDLSPQRTSKDNLLQSINRIDREISQVESEMTKFKKKQNELEAEALKPANSKPLAPVLSTVEPKQMSIAQIIYSENRKKAHQAHSVMEPFGQKVELPMYNQPSDTSIYHENKRKFMIFKKRLICYFKRKQQDRSTRENYLTETYSQLMQGWLKKMEKKECNTTKKAKDAKQREFFEKQFPELKKQREDRERFSRVGQRIRSDAELEEIMDGLQEQELEDKKMRSYAVIPPILLDPKQRGQYTFLNRNGLVEDPMSEYKDRQLLNIWTDQEKELFKEKYLQHPKNFSLIASYLERKSVSDCVQYYYLTKKRDNYKQMLRKHNVKKRTRALVKPQQQSVNIQGGISTRQQEEAKAAAAAAAATSSAASSSITSSSITSGNSMMSLSANSSIVTGSTVTTTTLTPAITTNAVAATSTFTTVSTCSSTSVVSSTVAGSGTEVLVQVKEEPTSHSPSQAHSLQPKKSIDEVKDGEEGGDEMSDDNEACIKLNETGGLHNCSICKTELENYNLSRPLTRKNCDLYDLKESDLVVDMRVCAPCRFKCVRKRCPIPSCKTPRRKVKRLRPLPNKFLELSLEAKEAFMTEILVPLEATKCCSACFNRIARKLGANPISENEDQLLEPIPWTEEEREAAKRGLRDYGTNWTLVASSIGTKTKEQCKKYYFTYKRKLELEAIVSEYRQNKLGPTQDGMVSDLGSGETTSSCEEDNCVDQVSSDTASASSPRTRKNSEKINCNVKDKKYVEGNNLDGVLKSEKAINLASLEPDSKSFVVNTNNLGDHDSSATVSADEGQGPGEVDSRGSPNQIITLSPTPMMPSNLHPKPDSVINIGSCHTLIHSGGQSGVEPLRPMMPMKKSLLRDPMIGTIKPELPLQHQSQPINKQPKEEPTYVRDLIYHAIEVSLKLPLKPGRNSTPGPPPVIPNLTNIKEGPLREMQIGKQSIEVHPSHPPLAHGILQRQVAYSVSPAATPPMARPEGLAMMASYSHLAREHEIDEVQDLSKKDKPLDRIFGSPPPSNNGNLKKEKGNRLDHGNYQPHHSGYAQYIAPPPAHSNQFSRTGQQPQIPAEITPPIYVGEHRREGFYPRSGSTSSGANPELRTVKSGYPSERIQPPPHLLSQPMSVPSSLTPPGRHLPPKMSPAMSKSSVPPPPPLITSSSKPPVMSPKMMNKIISPSHGSITEGTPVNKHNSHALPSNRYEGLLCQITPSHGKEVGSITLGTPLPHDTTLIHKKSADPSNGRSDVHQSVIDNNRGNGRSTVSEGLPRPGLPAVYDAATMEQYYRGSPTNYPGYQSSFPSFSGSGPQPNRPYESQLSSKQIMIDFNTSKQMQMRRGSSSSDKDSRTSPRPDSNPHAQLGPPTLTQGSSNQPDSRLHSVYAVYPPGTQVPFPAQSSSNVYIAMSGDTRFPQHESVIANTHPELQMSPGSHWPSGKHPVNETSTSSHGQLAPRQNVIHRSITYGTGKPPSVIQAPKSASPRAIELRADSSSPALKNSPSPRFTHPSLPTGHDAFNALVNAAAAQPSLAIPKDDKRVSSNRSEVVRSPRDAPAVEGLEKSLLEMHQRPRSHSEAGVPHHDRYREMERGRASADNVTIEGDHHHPQVMIVPPAMMEEQRYMAEQQHRRSVEIAEQRQGSLDSSNRDPDRLRFVPEHSPSLRFSGVREPFSKEQFEREMRQQELPASRSTREHQILCKREEVRVKGGENMEHMGPSGAPHPVNLEATSKVFSPTFQKVIEGQKGVHPPNLDEASKIFSQSFQKDHPKPNPSPRGFTAANLIDAIITHQINQQTDAPAITKNPAVDNIFNRYRPNEGPENVRDGRQKGSVREELVTIDDGPERERQSYMRIDNPRPTPPPTHHSQMQDSLHAMKCQNSEKAITLGEHIEAIISKNYSGTNDMQHVHSMYEQNKLSQMEGMPNSVGPLSKAQQQALHHEQQHRESREQQREMQHREQQRELHHREIRERQIQEREMMREREMQQREIEHRENQHRDIRNQDFQSFQNRVIQQQQMHQHREQQYREHQLQREQMSSQQQHRMQQPIHPSMVHPSKTRTIENMTNSGPPTHSVEMNHVGDSEPEIPTPVSGTGSWKLRRALQSDKDSSPLEESSHQNSQHLPSSSPVVNHDERQIIRIAQAGSPGMRSSHSSPITPTLTPYAVEPISPPGQNASDANGPVDRIIHSSPSPSLPTSSSTNSSSWITNPGITGLLTSKRIYGDSNNESQGRSSQQQMGLSPLDYVKNKIVEVMRTADNSETSDSRSQASSVVDDRETSQRQRYMSQMCPEEYSDRPQSTGSSRSTPKESSAVQTTNRYSPGLGSQVFVSHHPAHSLERTPSRGNETMRPYKRNIENNIGEWPENSITGAHRSWPPCSPPNCSEYVNSSESHLGPKKRIRGEIHYGTPESSTEKRNEMYVESSEDPSQQQPSRSHISDNFVSGSRSSPHVTMSMASPTSSPNENCHPQPSQADCEMIDVESSIPCKGRWEVSSAGEERQSVNDVSPQMADSPASGDMVIDESSNLNMTPSSSRIELVTPPNQEISTSEQAEPSDTPDCISSTMLNSSLITSVHDTSQSSSVSSSRSYHSSPKPPQVSGSGMTSSNPNEYSTYSRTNISSSNVSSSSPLYSNAPVSVAHIVSSSQPMNSGTFPPPFSGVAGTYAYPFSALTVRSMSAHTNSPNPQNNSSTQGQSNNNTPSLVPPQANMPPQGNSSSSNSPSSASRENHPAPLLSSQYEPLSDED